MSDGSSYTTIMPERRGRFVYAALALSFAALFAYASAQAQVGGAGGDPQASFPQDVGGGTGPTGNIDPPPDYLPAPPAGQTYQYTLILDFGDTSVQTVGPDTAANVIISGVHTYAHVFNTVYTVTLRIDVTIITNNVTSVGPSAITTGQVHAAQVNFPPTWSMTPISSPATGQLPYQFIVDVAGSYDTDGYIIWAAIDWGDGSTELLSKLPPSKVALPYFHSYSAQGTYTVTLSLIDNGRMDFGTPLDPTPPANDPANALKIIQTLQQTLLDNGTLDPQFNDPKYKPILRQDYLQVQVPGNLQVLKGQVLLSFASQNGDSFDSTFVLNTPVAAVANAKVSVFLGNALILKEFTTDLKGNFFDQAQGFSFTINARRHLLRFKVKNTLLAPALSVANATVVNGFLDVPLRIVIAGSGGTSMLGSKLRFVYNAQAGKTGIGKNPRSQLVGN